MHIVHVSAECYPVAKAGGLGDVVGALPKYLKEIEEYFSNKNLIQKAAIHVIVKAQCDSASRRVYTWQSCL